jgi:hypothetical protein
MRGECKAGNGDDPSSVTHARNVAGAGGRGIRGKPKSSDEHASANDQGSMTNK